MRNLIILVLILFLISTTILAAAQPKIPPPPDFLNNQSENTTLNDTVSNEQPEYIEIIPSENEIVDQNNSALTNPGDIPIEIVSANAPDNLPNAESPSSFTGLNIVFLILIIILSGTVIFLLFERRKYETGKSQQTAQTKQPNNINNTNQKLTTKIETQIVQVLNPQIKSYINVCRTQGFNDYQIRNELLKHGHSKQEVDKYF